MKHFNFLLITAFLYAQIVNSQIFTLKGTLTGFESGTKIIINPLLDNMRVDMDDETVIILKNEKFEFSRILEKPTKFSLRVRPQNPDKIEEYENLMFWVENKSMDLAGKKGQVFQSKITGSSIQEEYYEYILKVAAIENERKAIFDTVKINPNIPEEKKSELRKRVKACESELQEKWNDFVYNNPNYYCAAPELVSDITFQPDKIDVKKLKEFYKSLNPELKSNVYGKQINIFLNNQNEPINYKILGIGDYPYDFSLCDTSGKEIKFSSVKSRIILLDFWSSGCAPCRKEHKNYQQLYNDFKDKGLEIVSVSTDQSKRILTVAMIKDKITWISLWDANMEIYRDLYHVKALPTNYLIADGKILAINLRGEDLRHEIEKILNETNN
ncbi:MAG: AhpC/TSA family protein [Candidatus Atribacteria bacterium]|nr:AhpC/TSA family protein [Candidatus Atribacteria bacterium]